MIDLVESPLTPCSHGAPLLANRGFWVASQENIHYHEYDLNKEHNSIKASLYSIFPWISVYKPHININQRKKEQQLKKARNTC